MKEYCGVWVTMVTPYHENGLIDYDAVDALVEHFIDAGIDGIFAVCQSSEMFHLSERERGQLCARVVRAAAGRIRVIASGFTSYEAEDQARDVQRMRDAGAEASVLITGLIASKRQDDPAWRRNLELLCRLIPQDIVLGLYECPLPYKRLLTPELVRGLIELDRFVFLKETSCALEQIGPKISAADGSRLSILNANAQLLLPSMRMGARGFSGIMANMQAKLYAYLWNQRAEDGAGGLYDRLTEYLSASSAFESSGYPVSAKYALDRRGVRMSTFTRNPQDALSQSARYMLDRFCDLNQSFEEQCEKQWGKIRR